MTGKLVGKVAIVSGSGRGIGRSTALALATEGAAVVVNDLDPAPAQQVVDMITAKGGRATAFAGSVTEAGFAEGFVQAALENFGGLHIIVNNAGYAWDGVLQKMSDEQFEAMLDVHLKAPFRILRAASTPWRDAAKREQEQGYEVLRKVVNISSIAAVYGNAGQVNYAAGKAGIIGMTKSLAREWGRYKVNVNAVAFGLVSTRMTQATADHPTKVTVAGREVIAGIPESQLRQIEASIPLGRGARPEEAAGAIVLLCLPESDYVSGHVLMATGGL